MENEMETGVYRGYLWLARNEGFYWFPLSFPFLHSQLTKGQFRRLGLHAQCQRGEVCTKTYGCLKESESEQGYHDKYMFWRLHGLLQESAPPLSLKHQLNPKP